MKQKTNKLKEQALLTALRQKKALLRDGLKVYTLDTNGQRELLSTSEKKSDVWADALEALSDPSQKPDCVVDTDCLIVFTDGGSRGNPGPSAAGYVIMDQGEKILEDGGKYLGVTTNNQAEYRAVILALEAAKKYSPKRINVYMDSLLVVNQLKGTYKVKDEELGKLCSRIKDLGEDFKEVRFEHVYRKHNKLADEQVNIVLDQQAENA